MRKRGIILIAIILAIFLLTILLVFLEHKYEEAQSSGMTFVYSIEEYLFGLILTTIILIVPAFILGIITWLIFKNKKPEKIKYFLFFNLVSLTILVFANSREFFRIWHYKKYQANIDYNKSLTKQNGGYLDTCLILVQEDLESHGLSPNNYRILTYTYDQGLTRIPKDTIDKFYSFATIYFKTENELKIVRVAKYFINFNGIIKKLYDVDINDVKAKEQIEELKKNLGNLKTILDELPDSEIDFDQLKQKLKSLH